MKINFRYNLLGLMAGLVLILTLAMPANAQRRGGGSFGGGGRSFGGGGFGGGGRSFGGSSFGGGSFGGGSRSFGGGNVNSGSRPGSFNSGTRMGSGSSSFSRSGGFGSSGHINSTSINAPSAYRGVPYTTRSTYFYGGRSYPYYGYGGYGDYWFHPSWYYWMPFHPAFYYNAPYMGPDGAYYPGGFSFIRLLMGLVFFVFVIWLLSRLFGGGGGVKYTTYR